MYVRKLLYSYSFNLSFFGWKIDTETYNSEEEMPEFSLSRHLEVISRVVDVMSKYISLIILCLNVLHKSTAIDSSQLYDITKLRNLDALPRGDDQYQVVNLDVPVHLYGEKYESIYVRISFFGYFYTFSNDSKCLKICDFKNNFYALRELFWVK